MEKPSKGSVETLVLLSNMRGVLSRFMSSKPDVWQGTLALMILKTLERAGSLHGYGIARQIERTSADLLSENYGRSEEHTSELQSQSNLVCRLLLEKKKTK